MTVLQRRRTSAFHTEICAVSLKPSTTQLGLYISRHARQWNKLMVFASFSFTEFAANLSVVVSANAP